MPRRREVPRRLVAVFLLGCILFNYPMLSAFGQLPRLAGLPSVFIGLMLAWVAVIVLMAFIIEKSSSPDQ
jgi:hypothetical protein